MPIQLFFWPNILCKERYKVVCFVFWGSWDQCLEIRTIVHPILESYLQLEFCFAEESKSSLLMIYAFYD
jgi:hypothetical protein